MRSGCKCGHSLCTPSSCPDCVENTAEMDTSTSQNSSSNHKGDSQRSSSDEGHKKSHSSGPKENGTSNGSLSNHHHKDKHKHHSSSKHSSSDEKKRQHGDKKHSSSSSHGDKKHSSSSKHSSGEHKKHSSSSGEHKKHSSSSGEHKKHSSSSSSGDKKHHSSSHHGDKKHSSSSGEKKHSSSSSSKHKHSSSKHKEHKHRHGEGEVKKEEVTVKSEPMELPTSPGKSPGRSPIKSPVRSPMSSPLRSPVRSPMKEPKPMLEDSEDDMPLANRKPAISSPPVKRELSDDEDDQPLAARAQKEKKVKTEKTGGKKRKVKEEEDDEDDMPLSKKKKKGKKEVKKETKTQSPTKKGKAKKEEEQEKWRWWEETRVEDGTKWKFLEHQGPVFAPDYEPLPDNVRFYYDGKIMRLEPEAEEVMTFYGRMLDHDYTNMEVFNKNFFKDWRSVMTAEEKEKIRDLKKCRFDEINVYFKQKSEERKAMSKAEKLKIKEENAAVVEKYGFCTMDNHKEKIGNFKIEPPGLFRGRGSHPKMGMLKRRVMPQDVIINCSKDSEWPAAPEGRKWKEVRHDNTVTWLASWQENVQGGTKYVMLNPASRLKGEKDWMKYETARKLYGCVDKIRANYRDDWKSKEMRVRQRAVALYFIDKLALRAGNEKDDDTADTVGCCSLRVEHINLHEQLDGKECVVEFDFLGKDSIRYYNKVAVEKRVFKNLQLFMENKAPGDDLFDRLNTAIMNKHLQSLMDGLTAKVFRTFNASRTLQDQLNLLTNVDDPVAAKLLSYNRANRAVAVLCNHQRAIPKNFSKQMENIQTKIDAKKEAIANAKRDLKAAKSDLKAQKTEKNKALVERKKKTLQRLEEQLTKLEVALTDKDENKDIALGTSKLNYLDPRISVAWCKKWDVPIEKIYNKTQRDKFAWAIDMAEADYVF